MVDDYHEGGCQLVHGQALAGWGTAMRQVGQGPHLLIRRRAIASLLTLLIVSLLLPAVAVAAVPVANDDPGVTCVDPPEFGGGNFPIPEDYQVPGVFGGLVLPFECGPLANDVDADDDPLTYEILTGPGHGEVLKVDDDFVAYRPGPDYSTRAGNLPGGSWLSDSFTYHACDATDCSAPATMRFWIAPINDPPAFVGGPPLVTVEEDSGPYSGPWATSVSSGPANESDQVVSFEIVSLDSTGGPGLFQVPPAISSSGVLTFTPGHDQRGIAHVTVQAKDDGGIENYFVDGMLVQPDDTSDPITFDIVVDANGAPVAVDDVLAIPINSSAVPVPVLLNDVDVDGDPLAITGTTDGAHGIVTVVGGGSGLTYAPAAGYDGLDTFTYTISDGVESDTATVRVTVSPDVVPPVASAPVARLPGQTVGTRTTTARISWTATDANSGITGYRLQVSVDGGSWTTIALPTPTTTAVTRSLTVGHAYRFRVRATDGAGNVGAYAMGPSLTPLRYAEASTRITYVGSWTKTTSPKAFGGGARHATNSTRRATFAFTGYDVGWIATRTSSSGMARVYADGILVATVDLDRVGTAYRKLVFARHFPTLGPHTFAIQPIGGGRVDLDGFVILR